MMNAGPLDRPLVSGTFSQIFKGAIVFVFSDYAAALMAFFTKIVLARSLTVAEFGLFYAIMAFLSLIGLLKNMGFNRALVKFLPEFLSAKDLRAARQAILMTMGFSLLTSALVTLVVLALNQQIAVHYFHVDLAAKAVPVMLIYFVVSTFTSVSASVFHGFKKPLYIALRQFSQNAIILAAVLAIPNIDLMRLGWIHVGAVLLVLGGCLFGLFKLINLCKHSGRFSRRVFKQMASFAIPATGTTIASKSMGSMDNIMLTYFQTVKEVGYYNVAAPFARLFISLGSGVGKMIFPYSSELSFQKKSGELQEIVRRVQRLLLLTMVPLAVFFTLQADPILSIVFGDKFLPSSMATQILVLGGVIHALSLVNINIINGLGFPIKVTQIVMISGIINTCGNLLLIPVLSFVGAALATVFGYVVTNMLGWYYIYQKTSVSLDWRCFGRILICGAAAYAVGRLVLLLLSPAVWVTLPIMFLSTLGTYLSAIMLFHVASAEEITSAAMIFVRKGGSVLKPERLSQQK